MCMSPMERNGVNVRGENGSGIELIMPALMAGEVGNGNVRAVAAQCGVKPARV